MPEGLPTTTTIGAAGGTLASSDGRLKITVPAGALAADTLVGIQPITAAAPGALGHAYRLTPEGQIFTQPVSLTFSYSAAEAGATASDRRRVATHHADGRWSLPTVVHDATQRTLTVSTSHFSDWANVSGLLLRPADSVLAFGQSQSLYMVDCGWQPDPANPDAPPVMRECAPISGPGCADLTWSVNGVPRGDGSAGTVVSGGATCGARYTAPNSEPRNPVAVSVSDGRGGTLVAEVTVVNTVRVYSGAFFSKVATSMAWAEVSANVDFFHIPDPEMEAKGQWRYSAATGSAVLRSKIPDCDVGTGTDFVDPALTHLIITRGEKDSSPIAQSYQIGIATRPTITYRCTFGDVTIPVFTAPVVGLTANCKPPPLPEESSALADTWTCTFADGSFMNANWTLRSSR